MNVFHRNDAKSFLKSEYSDIKNYAMTHPYKWALEIVFIKFDPSFNEFESGSKKSGSSYFLNFLYFCYITFALQQIPHPLSLN